MAKRSSTTGSSGNGENVSRDQDNETSATDHFSPEITVSKSVDARKVGVEVRVSIEDNDDIVQARQEGRELARSLGFSSSHATLVATAISELARNIVLYAGRGEIILSSASQEGYIGLVISAMDRGPGISNIEHAMMSGFSSSGGLGLGLPGVKKIVDEFEIESEAGRGTRIVCTVWR